LPEAIKVRALVDAIQSSVVRAEESSIENWRISSAME
jgi:hypothetical protein